MKKIIMLISALAVLIVAMSGCVDDSENPGSVEMSVENLVMVNEAPEGFEYLGALPITVDDVKRKYVDVPGIIDAGDGTYQRSSDSLEIHVTVVEMENNESAQGFISDYKASFKELRTGGRFTDESFNGHFATRIKDYVTSNGDDEARYSYIWNNESFVFIVEGNEDGYTLTRSMAEATGY